MIKIPAIAMIIFAIICIMTAVPAHCQYDNPAPNLRTIGGTVTAVDSQNSQITIKTTETFIFSVPSGAKIINKDGFDIQLGDINPGNYAMVDYYDDRSGNHIAKNIEIEYNR